MTMEFKCDKPHGKLLRDAVTLAITRIEKDGDIAKFRYGPREFEVMKKRGYIHCIKR